MLRLTNEGAVPFWGQKLPRCTRQILPWTGLQVCQPVPSYVPGILHLQGRESMDQPHTKPCSKLLQDESDLYRYGTVDCLFYITSEKIMLKHKCLSAQLDGIFLHSRDFFPIFYYFSSGWRVWFRASIITIITLSGWHISMVPITVIETLGPLHHSSFTPRLLLICPNKI